MGVVHDWLKKSTFVESAAEFHRNVIHYRTLAFKISTAIKKLTLKWLHKMFSNTIIALNILYVPQQQRYSTAVANDV